MPEIKITITIPEHEYKQWDEYREDGVALCKQSVRKDLNTLFKQNFVEDYEIQIEDGK
jgi:hypothetical protein